MATFIKTINTDLKSFMNPKHRKYKEKCTKTKHNQISKNQQLRENCKISKEKGHGKHKEANRIMVDFSY